MSLLNTLFIYLLVWWVTLFLVLPLGIERNADPGQGHDTGAPVTANLKKKLILNSVVAAVVVGIIWILVYTGVIQWGHWFRNAIQ